MVNLTLASLEDVSATCTALRNIEQVGQRQDMLDEIRALQTEVDGHIKMIEDLSLAVESLQHTGFSQEWMDLMNKDNALVAVTKLELPKFFGGNEAKAAACEGAIWDTIKNWLAAVWKWIKDLCAKLMKFISWFVALWVHRENQMVGKAIVNTVSKTSKDVFEKAGSHTLEVGDPVTICAYVEKFARFCNVVVPLLRSVITKINSDRWNPNPDNFNDNSLPGFHVWSSDKNMAKSPSELLNMLESNKLDDPIQLKVYLIEQLDRVIQATPFIDYKNTLQSWNFALGEDEAGSPTVFCAGDFAKLPKIEIISGVIGWQKEITNYGTMLDKCDQTCNGLVNSFSILNNQLKMLRDCCDKEKKQAEAAMKVFADLRDAYNKEGNNLSGDIMEQRRMHFDLANRVIKVNIRAIQTYLTLVSGMSKYYTDLMGQKTRIELALHQFMARVIDEAKTAAAAGA